MPLPPTPRLTEAIPVSSQQIRTTWVSSVDLTLQFENFTVVAVTFPNGKATTSYYFNMKSSGDKRTEKNYDLTIRKLQPFTEYKVYVYACKLIDGRIVRSKISNEIKAKTLESGILDFTLCSYFSACS